LLRTEAGRAGKGRSTIGSFRSEKKEILVEGNHVKIKKISVRAAVKLGSRIEKKGK